MTAVKDDTYHAEWRADDKLTETLAAIDPSIYNFNGEVMGHSATQKYQFADIKSRCLTKDPFFNRMTVVLRTFPLKREPTITIKFGGQLTPVQLQDLAENSEVDQEAILEADALHRSLYSQHVANNAQSKAFWKEHTINGQITVVPLKGEYVNAALPDRKGFYVAKPKPTITKLAKASAAVIEAPKSAPAKVKKPQISLQMASRQVKRSKVVEEEEELIPESEQEE